MPHRIPRKIRHWLQNADSFLLATFFIGFMIIGVFIAIVYARYLDEQREKAVETQDEKIIVASIASCRRTNELRVSVNNLHNALDTFIKASVKNPGYSSETKQDLQDIANSISTVRVPNCQVEIRTITGRLLEREEHRND